VHTVDLIQWLVGPVEAVMGMFGVFGHDIEAEDQSGAIAVAVELENRTDYIISSLDEEPRQYGPVTMTGHFGFVSVAPDGQVLWAYLLDGTKLSCGATEISLPAATMALKVASVDDRTFNLEEDVPADLRAQGTYLLAADSGYEIESHAERSVTVRDYPAIECDHVLILNSVWFEKLP